MNFNNIDFETYAIILGLFLVFAFLSSATAKMSPSTLKKIINEYDALLADCNNLLAKVNQTVERIKEKFYESAEDEESALRLLQEYNEQYNTIILCNERIGHYINKRNAKYYRRYKKKADKALLLIEEISRSLEQIEWRMRTEEYRREENTEQEHKDSYFEDEQRAQHEPVSTDNTTALDVFFLGCNSIEEVEKRYKSLAKVYHPDMPTGDTVTFQKILNEYERRKLQT